MTVTVSRGIFIVAVRGLLRGLVREGSVVVDDSSCFECDGGRVYPLARVLRGVLVGYVSLEGSELLVCVVEGDGSGGGGGQLRGEFRVCLLNPKCWLILERELLGFGF